MKGCIRGHVKAISNNYVTLFPAYVFICVKPNVMGKWLTLLLRIREVPGSKLSRVTGYSD
jgi:hypothetical protein